MVVVVVLVAIAHHPLLGGMVVSQAVEVAGVMATAQLVVALTDW